MCQWMLHLVAQTVLCLGLVNNLTYEADDYIINTKCIGSTIDPVL